MANEELARETRSVFHGIHVEQAGDAKILKRIASLVSTEMLGVAPDFFHDKVCGDLGCGSAVPGTCNLLQLGAKRVHAMDVDESIIATGKAVLEREPSFAGRWQIDVGSLVELPYADGTFDFVLCQGVIHHMGEDDRTGLSEIARVLKTGGMANIMVLGKGGLMARIVMEAMREEYRSNAIFRTLVDGELTPDWIRQQIDWLIERVDDDGSPEYRKSVLLLESLRDLLDQDFILTLRDRMTAPVYKNYGWDEMIGMLREAGFSSWRRVARKPTFRNVRKVLAPIYHDYDSPLARLLYGDGSSLIFVATK